jgi:hypothetical protein
MDEELFSQKEGRTIGTREEQFVSCQLPVGGPLTIDHTFCHFDERSEEKSSSPGTRFLTMFEMTNFIGQADGQNNHFFPNAIALPGEGHGRGLLRFGKCKAVTTRPVGTGWGSDLNMQCFFSPSFLRH